MSGRKTRPPEHCSGGSPRSPFLRFGQCLSSPLSRRHRLGVLYHALEVVHPPFRPQPLWRGRPPYSLLGGAPLHRHHRRRTSPVAVLIGGSQFSYPWGGLPASPLPGGGRGKPSPLLAATCGQPWRGGPGVNRGKSALGSPRHRQAAAFLCGWCRHPWAVIRGRCPLTARGLAAGSGRCPHFCWRLPFTLTLFCCRRRLLWLAGGAGWRPPLCHRVPRRLR